ncbi:MULTISPECIES: aldehyde dehydrogenase family protein [Brevibacterium]|uniref:aldehyde dehydrogenase family protein n=1 Tax=Brevibacterium TaxID=1696 RepID=UPI001FE5F2C4|nr:MULTISPECIES: aldehyde dehydrogenase family protein [Brevibacterium]
MSTTHTSPDPTREEPAPGTSAGAASVLRIEDPTTGDLVGEIDCDTAEAITGKVTAAHAAARDWEATAVTERARLLTLIADGLESAVDELAGLNHRETGKSLEDSRGGIEAGISTLRQYAELGPVHRGFSLRGDRLAADFTRHRARGVVAVITPWNDPAAIAAGLIGAALVMGNTVVHKPSERCPHLGARLGEICSAVLPEGVLATVTGTAEAGRMLTDDERIAMYAHVGSTAAGRDIHSRATAHGAHVIRENGGNDALLVDSGVDIGWAAGQAALGSFANAGQICTSVERIFVHRDVARDFTAALVAEADAWNGSPQPLVDRRHRQQVHRLLTQSREMGASVHTGGAVPDGPGAHYPATVVGRCRPEMPIMSDEVFGPVAPICVVDDFAQGLELAAADPYGLAATVLSPDLGHVLAAIDTLRVGTVKVNAVFGGAPGGSAEPLGESGSGFGFGPELLDEFATTSVIHISGGTQ